MAGDLSRRLVSDELWALAEPLLPAFTPRRQGGGTAPVDERAVLTAVVYVLTSGCAWRLLPPWLGVSPATAHRRFTAWTEAGVWRRLRRTAVRGGPARPGESDWAAVIVDAAAVRAAKVPFHALGKAPHETDTKSQNYSATPQLGHHQSP
ncbi:transposase [Streptomyces sp. NBC_00663]|uniref:transposase n=1 Tax=Streptomyces sp. NBC_00663 TaxID=2975801 RepID=UPI002E2F3C25|nr:transposase [Streptomyces sp. NBC_00663]